MNLLLSVGAHAIKKKLNGALCQMLNYHFSDSNGACTHNLKVQDSTLECIDVRLN